MSTRGPVTAGPDTSRGSYARPWPCCPWRGMKGFPARRAAQQKPGWQWDKERAAELIHPKRFQARGEGIRDLSFLEGLTGLKELDLWDNDIGDLSPLASLTGLGTSPTWNSTCPQKC